MKWCQIVLSIFIANLLIGCSHSLNVKNLSQYRVTTIQPLVGKVSIGILSDEEDINLKYLVRSVGEELQKFSKEVILPYNRVSGKSVDVLADIRFFPEYKGSGWNFLVNFPGFLIWAPAWNGYVYRVNYNVEVSLISFKKNEKIDSFQFPIHLNVRHAEIDRTWTEISWFEVGIIAFIGGLYNISYDNDVTPILANKAGRTIGKYVSSEIINRINGSKQFSYLGN